jgi:hypothetical protein
VSGVQVRWEGLKSQLVPDAGRVIRRVMTAGRVIRRVMTAGCVIRRVMAWHQSKAGA